MSTCDTTAWVRGVLRCAKNQNRTCTCSTHFKSTVGLPAPVLNPRHTASCRCARSGKKQVVMVDDMWCVDFCNCFGNQGLYKVFLSFTSMVAWIAEHIKRILNLKICIDNNTCFKPTSHVLYCEPYQWYFPANQTKLLIL